MSSEEPRLILLIDDEPLIRKSIAVYLEDNGYLVVQAENGWKGIELFDQNRPDLVLTDLMMPGMDGLAVLRAIKERADEIPVVVVSGNGSVNYAVEAMREGAWDYITKPIHDFCQLDLMLDQCLKRAEQMKEDKSRQFEMALHSVDLAEQLARLKEHDQLTGLPQRQQLQDFFYKTVIRSDFSGVMHLLLLDLDNLKLINKSLGLEYGDMLLAELASRFKEIMDEHLMISRLGGDQFVFLSTANEELHTLIKRLRDILAEPVKLAGESFKLTAGMGISDYPQDGESLGRLLQNANIALGKAKCLGKNSYCLYQSELGTEASRIVMLETQLQNAMQRNEFNLYYQPKVNALTREIAGMEVLLRWNRKNETTIIGPDLFVPLLEESGLIVDVGSWVLLTACRQYSEWRMNGMPPLVLSVNLSAAQFLTGNLPQYVADILIETGMEPSSLCLELTESIFLQGIEHIEEILKQIAEQGIRLSIDDFGTGYSSLSYLLKMPIDELKIDRAFVKHLPADRHAAAITDSVLTLAQSMGISVVAEGVEMEEQASYLIERGCQELQGYLFSRPIPPEEFQRNYFRK